MNEQQKEKLGILIDGLENLSFALDLPLPDHMHVAALRDALPQKVEELKELFIEVTNENPWL